MAFDTNSYSYPDIVQLVKAIHRTRTVFACNQLTCFRGRCPVYGALIGHIWIADDRKMCSIKVKTKVKFSLKLYIASILYFEALQCDCFNFITTYLLEATRHLETDERA